MYLTVHVLIKEKNAFIPVKETVNLIKKIVTLDQYIVPFLPAYIRSLSSYTTNHYRFDIYIIFEKIISGKKLPVCLSSHIITPT